MRITAIMPNNSGVTVQTRGDGGILFFTIEHETIKKQFPKSMSVSGVDTVVRNIDVFIKAINVAYHNFPGSGHVGQVMVKNSDFAGVEPSPQKMMLRFGAKALCNAVINGASAEEMENIAKNVLLSLDNFEETAVKPESDIEKMQKVIYKVITDGWEMELDSSHEDGDGNQDLAADIVAALDYEGLI